MPSRRPRTAAPALTSMMVVIVLLSLPVDALAYDVWTAPYDGVRHLHRVRGTFDVHAVLIDLTSSGVSVVATRPEDRYLTVRDFATRYDASIAVNANYFDSNAKSCGLAAGDGEVWSDSYEEGCAMSIGFGRLNEALPFESSGEVCGPLPEPWMTDVVSGKPWLVREGVVQGGWAAPRHILYGHPRTAIGLSEDRQTLILVVCDGRRDGVPGMNGDQLAQLMLELGGYDALNLDGGGSSELFIRSESGVQNRPSDGHARYVATHFGVRTRPMLRWLASAQQPVRASLGPAELSPSERLARLEATLPESRAPERPRGVRGLAWAWSGAGAAARAAAALAPAR